MENKAKKEAICHAFKESCSAVQNTIEGNLKLNVACFCHNDMSVQMKRFYEAKRVHYFCFKDNCNGLLADESASLDVVGWKL